MIDGSGGSSPEPKRFYHSIRLLKEAKSILNGNEVGSLKELAYLQPRVFWEGYEREEIMSIRRGEWESEKVLSLIKQLEAEVDQLMVCSSLQ